MLASSIVEVLQSQQQHVLFFSFSGTDASRQTLDALVRASLWQLLQEIAYEQSFSIMYKLMFRGQPLTSELWDAFSRAAALLTAPIYWIIDGVDECQDSSQGLFEQVLDFLATHENLRGVLLGRPQMLGATGPLHYTIEVNAGMTNADIDAFIDSEISKSELLRLPELRDTAFETIREKSDGMFLWVKLMIDDLRKSASRYEVQERLRNFPRGLEETYRSLLVQLVDRLDHFELNLARNVLAFTVASSRTLTLEELLYAHALQSRSAFNSSKQQSLQGSLLVEPIQKILHVCGSLVTITDNTVRLVHTTAKEFLTRPHGDWLCENDQKIKRLRIDLEDSHRVFGSVCLDYLRLCEYDFPLQCSDSLSELSNRFPFLEYASRYAMHHLNRSGAPSPTTIENLNRFLRSAKSVFWLEFFAMLWIDDSSTGWEMEEFQTFMTWLEEGDPTKRLMRSLAKGFDHELANRVREFGEHDSRTEQLRMLLCFVAGEDEAEDSNASLEAVDATSEAANVTSEATNFTSEATNITFAAASRDMSTEISQLWNLLFMNRY